MLHSMLSWGLPLLNMYAIVQVNYVELNPRLESSLDQCRSNVGPAQTETEMSLWEPFSLSEWQLSVQTVTEMLSKWECLSFNERGFLFPHRCCSHTSHNGLWLLLFSRSVRGLLPWWPGLHARWQHCSDRWWSYYGQKLWHAAFEPLENCPQPIKSLCFNRHWYPQRQHEHGGCGIAAYPWQRGYRGPPLQGPGPHSLLDHVTSGGYCQWFHPSSRSPERHCCQAWNVRAQTTNDDRLGWHHLWNANRNYGM